MLSVCVTLAACGVDEEPLTFGPIDPGIVYAPMYSAFGGSHAYAVAAIVSGAADSVSDNSDFDPPLASTLVWRVDEKLTSMEPFDAIPGAVKLTTRQAGFADVEVQGTYRRGSAFKTRARLNIAVASDRDWARGEARYYTGPSPSLATLRASISEPHLADSARDCVVSDIREVLPQDSACAGCHDDASTSDFVNHTPMQTAGYSDEQLIAIITEGQKPAGGTFNSELLRDHPRPDCVFAKFHAWSVNDEDRLGLVLKLRSLAPQVIAPLD
jgi:hypothetical protein